MIISIDGSVASGKTTVGKIVGSKTGYIFFDTGILYRAIAWLTLEKDLDIALNTQLNLSQDGNGITKLDVNGIIIDAFLYSPEVDKKVSEVAALDVVRSKITGMIRAMVGNEDVVIVGRDIGSVVFPNAEIKVYLHASVQER